MKTFIIISVISLLLFFGCGHDGEKNGMYYDLQKRCVKSHTETHLVPHIIGKQTYYLPSTRTVCDAYVTDTIWTKKEKLKEK